MRKTLSLLLTFFFLLSTIHAQQIRKCATHDKHLELLEQDSEYRSKVEKIERETVDYLRQSKLLSQQNSVITIPVVVHVLWKTNNQNISDAQIQSQIDVLNEAFRKLNANLSNTLPDFIDRVGDMEIEFCLATVDPQGLPTTGITRKQTDKSSWGTNDAIKKPGQGGVAPWPVNRYLNMWVGNIGNSILGYAQFPGGPAATDGIVISPQYFGSKAKGTGFFLESPFDLGATVTHEVGHWLNLRHIWGDGNCSVDDFVDDTPNANGPNYGCPLDRFSCNSLDNVQNYMDYTNDACMTMFTAGQVARSRALFAPGGVRSGLLSSNGCGVPIPICLAPTNIVVTGNGSSANLSFTPSFEATSYNIFLKEANQVNFNLVGTISNTSTTLNNLSECTVYDVKIEADCSENELGTSTSGVVSFNSKGSGCTCDNVSNLSVEVINNTQARLTWDPVEAATQYRFEGRLKGGLGLVVRKRNINAPQTTFVTNALFANLTYEVRVRTFCDGLGLTDWSPWTSFKLSMNGKAADVSENERSIDLFPEISEILTVYPNPATSFIKYRFMGERLDNVYVSLIDLSGRVLKQQRVSLDYDSENTLNVDDISNGIYLLRFVEEGVDMTTQKVVIMR
jgi:hypothetical protein